LPLLAATPTLEWQSRLRRKARGGPCWKSREGPARELILQKFQAHYDVHGAGSLLVDGTRVVVHGSGVEIDHGENADPLAAVP
jgi:hypothetical protein